uniref:NADP-dependent oxidoreductase domain-containing protein n=1 Tax=Panagrolaimus sp. ES5 TaxID=591445 RepID=A0AC34GD30_9BILA
MSKVGTLLLSNGRKLPLLGLGTWQASDEKQLDVALRTALDIVVEEYIKNGKFKREDIYITSKLPTHGHKNTEIFIERSLERLRTNYIDLNLIHAPMQYLCNPETKEPKEDAEGKRIVDLVPFNETWKVFEKFYDEGKLKAIGISNFNQKQIQKVYDQARIKPHNLEFQLSQN